MKPFLRNLILGILAGVAISLGAAANVAARLFITDLALARVIGAFLFPVGLITVCSFGLNLYTGKIGYLLDNTNKDYASSLLAMFLGNFIGAVLMGLIFMPIKGFGKDAEVFVSGASSFLDAGVALAKGFVCGLLVFIAVDIFKKKSGVTGAFGLWLATASFVFIGASHCIANMFYMSLSFSWAPTHLLNLLLVVIGNSAGSLFFRLLTKLTEKKEEVKE